eukprot:15448179-Alexandrium_andersonii.AAC.1
MVGQAGAPGSGRQHIRVSLALMRAGSAGEGVLSSSAKLTPFQCPEAVGPRWSAGLDGLDVPRGP